MGSPLKKDTLRTDHVQRRAARFVKNYYRIYLKEEQHYNSVTKMINSLGWRDLADRRRDIHLTLLFKIVNHQVNVTSEGIFILAKAVTRNSQEHNKLNIDDYKCSFSARTITERYKLQGTTNNIPVYCDLE